MTEALWEQEKDDVFNVVADIDSPSAQIQYAFNAGVLAALAAERARADAAVAALRTVRESILAPWTVGGFVCGGCGEWSEQRETIPHEACWLSDEARAILQAAGQRGGLWDCQDCGERIIGDGPAVWVDEAAREAAYKAARGFHECKNPAPEAGGAAAAE